MGVGTRHGEPDRLALEQVLDPPALLTDATMFSPRPEVASGGAAWAIRAPWVWSATSTLATSSRSAAR